MTIDRLKRGLIVSCQAGPPDGLHGPAAMAAMARAATLGGAAGIRANGPDDIAAIRTTVDVPIVGIYKQDLPDFDVRITPSLEAARAVVDAGADIVALDATHRPHPGGLSAADLIRLTKQSLGVPVMADVSTVEEGVAAAHAGADLVATTLSGHTPYSPQIHAPDFELVAQLAAAIDVPVVSEGHIAAPREARRMLELGAYAVVVGSMITRPRWIVERYVAAMRAAPAPGRAVLALDIGGTKIAGGLVDGEGRVLFHREIPAPVNEGAGAVLRHAITLLDAIGAESRAAPVAVGVSTGGQVDAAGNIVHATGLIPGWASVPLRQTLEDHFGLPAAILNDGSAAALGEAHFGAGRGHATVLGLTLGTGLGGGMVVEGELFAGATALGHVKVVREGRACTCGNAGCLEVYVNGAALLHEYNARAPGSALASAREVAARIALGDPAACDAVRAVGEWLGFGLAGILSALRPTVVVVGGGLAQVGDLLLESARLSLQAHAFPTLRATPVVPAALGPQAGLVGAAVYAQQHAIV